MPSFWSCNWGEAVSSSLITLGALNWQLKHASFLNFTVQMLEHVLWPPTLGLFIFITQQGFLLQLLERRMIRQRRRRKRLNLVPPIYTPPYDNSFQLLHLYITYHGVCLKKVCALSVSSKKLSFGSLDTRVRITINLLNKEILGGFSLDSLHLLLRPYA